MQPLWLPVQFFIGVLGLSVRMNGALFLVPSLGSFPSVCLNSVASFCFTVLYFISLLFFINLLFFCNESQKGNRS